MSDINEVRERLSRGVWLKSDISTLLADHSRLQARVAELEAAPGILASDHQGMRVDYSGLLSQARNGLRDEPGIAEMIGQLSGHLGELGRRWYAGDTCVVDEFLQLYCVEVDARQALIDGSQAGEAQSGKQAIGYDPCPECHPHIPCDACAGDAGEVQP